MAKRSTGNLNRREFLRATASGACSVCLGLVGLSRSGRATQTGGGLLAEKGLIKPRSARWFETVENDIRCTLCPWLCRLAEGERARCRVRENREGEGVTLAHSNPALVQEDPVERKPFFHVLPGSRALSVSTAGCNLDCKFCEVWDMALSNPEEVHAFEMPPARVVDHAQSGNLKAISFAFGEPVVFYEYMLETAQSAKEAGLKNLVHTAGYIQPEPLDELASQVDAVNVDLKSFESSFYREVVGGELGPVLDTLRKLYSEDLHLEITNILIPTLNDDLEMIREMSEWIVEQLGPEVPLHFARFYPLYRLSDLPRTPVSTIDKARSTAQEAGLKYVYVTGVTGHEGEDTFCPNCREVLIKREGFYVDEIHVEDGKCSYCGEKISGLWKD